MNHLETRWIFQMLQLSTTQIPLVLDPEEITMLSRCGLVVTRMSVAFVGPTYLCSVEPGNIMNWVTLLLEVTKELMDLYLVYPRNQDPASITRHFRMSAYHVRTSPPSEREVVGICLRMGFLHKLRPVLKCLLSSRSFALETSLLTAASAAKQRRRVASQKHGLSSGTAQDPEFFPEQHEHITDSVIRAYDTVLAWHTSANFLFRHRHLFPNPNLNIQFLSYNPMASLRFSNLQAACQDILAWKDPNGSFHSGHYQELAAEASNGTVHAEALLMSYLISAEAPEEIRKLAEKVIGVGKKCCAICWLLAQILTQQRLAHFVLPGTHATYYPWVAPLNLPTSVLLGISQNL
ncbi:hypothetical protein D9757_014964 [Collybiopsis confluens]|uniref:Uncharacterized protein n=1 Tax=Collybiopsis confluens TaxID=2823264 RepID=A0A8H5CPS7_9AGAR|nr:hypothetical protein D9757_014964 [Collybiopsis confluens]